MSLNNLHKILLPVTLAAAVIVHLLVFNLPADYVLGTVALFWLSTVPGYLVLRLLPFWKSRSAIESIAQGTAAGLIITPVIFILLRTFDQWLITPYVVSAVNVVLGALHYVRRDGSVRSYRDQGRAIAYLALGVLAIATGYSFMHFHYLDNGALLYRGYFGIDLPFLAGLLPGILEHGVFADYHQWGLKTPYHDLTYLFIASAKHLSGASAMTMIAHSFPLYGFFAIACAAYALTDRFANNTNIAILGGLSWLFFGTIVGSEAGTNALSPSYITGSVILLTILMLMHHAWDMPRGRERIWTFILIALLTIGLQKTKIPSYLLLQAGMGIAAIVLLLRGKRELGLAFIAISVVNAVVLLFGSSGSSTIQPQGDFLIGAPLLGYGNHLSRILGLSPESMNPVIKELDVHWRHVLILPFTLFHVVRFTLLDLRMLVVLVGLVYLWRQYRLRDEEMPITHLLFPMMLVGAVLPVLYSPSWYPMALAFYTINISSQLAGIGAVIMLGILLRINPGHWVSKVAMAMVGLSILLGVIHLVRESRFDTRVIDEASLKGFEWLRNNSQPDDLVASRRYDLYRGDTIENDESYYIQTAYSEREAISVGAVYGSLLGSTLPTDTAKGLHLVPAAKDSLERRRWFLDSIFFSTNAATVRQLALSASVDYIIEHKLTRSEMRANAAEFADSVFSNRALTIWRVRD